MATFSVPRPVVNPPPISVPGNIGPPENNFSFGRSQFDGIRPGTPQILNAGSNWGRIRSVGKKKCLDLTLETNYPVTANCSIFDDYNTDQSWQYSTGQHLKYYDADRVHSEEFFLCLYAFGDKEDNTGFVRMKGCPGSEGELAVDPDQFENAEWEPILNTKNAYEFRMRNTEIDMCLGEQVIDVKAGKAGKPGPARVRTTWALVDCEKAPWWNFLHVFDEFKLDEKLCKVSGDPDACLRYKNQNRKLPPGLANNGFGMQADPYAADFSMRDSQFPEDYDEEKIQELYEAYMAMYEYYLDPTFESNYDYDNY